jgi:hypothetical protein
MLMVSFAALAPNDKQNSKAKLTKREFSRIVGIIKSLCVKKINGVLLQYKVGFIP